MISGTVLHIPRRFTRAAWGGTERLLIETLRRQRAAGADSRIVTTTVMDAVRQEDIDGIPVARHPSFYPQWPLSADKRAAADRKGGNLVSWGVAHAVGEAKGLAMVHLHTGNRLGAQCLRAARRRSVPCVISLHGGHFSIPAAEQADLAAPRRGFTIEWGRALSWWWGVRGLLEAVDAVICVGREEYEAARKKLPRQRVEFLPGGVDPVAFARGDRGAGRTRFGLPTDFTGMAVLCLGRLDRQKDQLTLVAAWKRLGRADAALILAGPETSPGYSAELMRAAEGGPGPLRLLGNVPPESVPDLLAAADVVVLPSRHEPFGLAVLEAWAAGRAVVAAAVGGPAWLLADGAGGLLFPVGDVPALATALGGLLADPARAAALGAAGRALATARFTWDHHVQALDAIYAAVGKTVGKTHGH